MNPSPIVSLHLDHLTKELKARGDLDGLPSTDLNHLELDIRRFYERLIPEWLKYTGYLKDHYPYPFNLAMQTNPFDPASSMVIQ